MEAGSQLEHISRLRFILGKYPRLGSDGIPILRQLDWARDITLTR